MQQNDDYRSPSQHTDPYQTTIQETTNGAKLPHYKDVADIDPQAYERQQAYQQGYRYDGPAATYPQQPQPAQSQASGPQDSPQMPTLGAMWQGMPQQAYGQPQLFMAYPLQPMQPIYQMPIMHNEPGILARLWAALSYVGGWVTGLLILLFNYDNRFVRFHALQSLTFFGMGNIVLVGLFSYIRLHLPLRWLAILAFMLVCTIMGIGWLVGVFNGLAGRKAKLPFVGGYAEHITAPPTPGTVK